MIGAPSERLMDLLLIQYRNSPNFIKYLECYAEEMDEIYHVLTEMIECRYYDKATGERLDVIASIVGANRVLEGVVIAGNFGYLQVAESLGMGRRDDPALGGPLRSIKEDGVEDVVLTDARLKNWIDARIIKNKTACNTEDTIAFFKLLLDDPELKVKVMNPKPATAVIELGRKLSINEAALIVSLAQHVKPVGVEFIVQDQRGVIETLPVGYAR
ncbi:Pf11041 family protein [Aeromonas phage pAh6.2TG]|uniref:Pf11041 family protein n=1 Tax=Aeromonas phage pAh6.2TG TaxID=2849625 RepID=A0A8F3C935_9CAUD|nr:Pf11041 family protein [Aeromonas phage pAh6.2TG]QWY14039.1 Pf11041 family protein [Aeromonas phage pAh6.2TG]